MKKTFLFFVFSVLIIAVNMNCKSSNTSSVGTFETFDPIESQSFTIHDSTYFFYQDFCEKIMEKEWYKDEILLVNRGFIYNVEVHENELKFENEVKDKYHWWIRGESKRRDDYFELRYTISSPNLKTA